MVSNDVRVNTLNQKHYIELAGHWMDLQDQNPGREFCSKYVT